MSACECSNSIKTHVCLQSAYKKLQSYDVNIVYSCKLPFFNKKNPEITKPEISTKATLRFDLYRHFLLWEIILEPLDVKLELVPLGGISYTSEGQCGELA